MKLHNIEELKNTVSNISGVPIEIGRYIFSFINECYEKENNDVLQIQAKNKRALKIFKRINNEVENAIRDDVCNCNRCSSKYMNIDNPMSCHMFHFYNDDKGIYGVSDSVFETEVYNCLLACGAIERFKCRGKVDTGVGYYFCYNKKNAKIFNLILVAEMQKKSKHYNHYCRIRMPWIGYYTEYERWDFIR